LGADYTNLTDKAKGAPGDSGAPFALQRKAGDRCKISSHWPPKFQQNGAQDKRSIYDNIK
jgi:hypothetical protein